MAPYHLDLETRSRADLLKVGAYRYANDPSTRILMFAISHGGEGPFLWLNPEFGIACATNSRAMFLLKQAFTDPKAIIYAHNSEFEQAVIKYRSLPDLGLPEPGVTQWRCTAAMARKAGLPGSLGAVSEALNLGQKKWGEGMQLIRLFSIPQKDTGQFIEPRTQQDKFRRFGEYCLQDVRSEMEVHETLKPFELQGTSLDTFLLTAQMNYRGLPVNREALQHAQNIIVEVQTRVTKEFVKLTGMQPTQRDKVKELLEQVYGVKLANMQSKTLDDHVAGYHEEEEDEEPLEVEEIPDSAMAIRILELYKQVSFTAVKKVKTMLDCVCDDGFVRGSIMYYGAGTGRWSGRLIQPQNFKKPTFKNAHLVYQMLCDKRSAEEIEMVFGNPLEAIANCIRNFLHDLLAEMFDADYSAVEARIVCWLAGQEDALEDYRSGVDRYKKMAASVYGKRMSDITADERELGKRCELGCGYQMGWEKFKRTCWSQYRIRISQDLAIHAVDTYRSVNDKVVAMWNDMSNAAKNAIRNPRQIFVAGRIKFVVRRLVKGIDYLIMTLPSGRSIVYPHPKIEVLEDDDRPGITYYGKLKGKKWGRVRTYGGSLLENATQGTAADVMSHGAVEAEKNGYWIWTLVHDQALAAVRACQSIEAFVQLLTTLPPWAEGLPIKAEGRVQPYYTK